VQSKDKDYILITLAIYDIDSKKWIDMMRDEPEFLDVVQWQEIDDVKQPYKLFNSLKSHKYREIYKNCVSKETP